MELGIKQLVSIALVVAVGMMLLGLSDDVTSGIRTNLTETVNTFNGVMTDANEEYSG